MQQHRNKVRQRISFEAWQLVESLIREDWGPEQISIWFSKEKKPSVNHEWIYQQNYSVV
jgi:IS30 family transposase